MAVFLHSIQGGVMNQAIQKLLKSIVFIIVTFSMLFTISSISFAASNTSKEKIKAQKKAKSGISESNKAKRKSGAGVKLLYPNGNEKLIIGRDINIRWKFQELRGNVRLELWRGNKFVSTIDKHIPIQKGGLKWKAGLIKGQPVPVGKRYRIRILSEENKNIKDFSNSNFFLSHKKKPRKSKTSETLTMEVKWPRTNDTLYVGSRTKIMWISPAGTAVRSADPVTLRLVGETQADGTLRVQTIASRLPNNTGENNYTWVISRMQYSHLNGRYKVIIQSEAGLRGESNFFNVLPVRSDDNPGPDGGPPDPSTGEYDPLARDVELGPLDDADVRFWRVSRDVDQGNRRLQDTYRLSANLRIRNNTFIPGPGAIAARDIASLPCRWTRYTKSSDGNFYHFIMPTTTGIIQVGPFRSLGHGEWDRCLVEIDLILREANRLYNDQEFYIVFEIQESSRFNDPNMGNNGTHTRIILRQARD